MDVVDTENPQDEVSPQGNVKLFTPPQSRAGSLCTVGWRVNSRKGGLDNGKAGRPRIGYALIHSAIDGHSRLPYWEILAEEQATTAIGFWRRAREFFAIRHHRREGAQRQRLVPRGKELHRRARVHRRQAAVHQALPAPDRRQNRALQLDLLNEWAYARPYQSEAARTRALDTWLQLNNE